MRFTIAWLNDPAKLCLQLLNARRTWITVQAEDSVILSHEEKTCREVVDSIDLYRKFPASENGREVRSAWHWLNAA